MSDISIPEESEIRPMKINQFKTKVSLAEKDPNNLTTKCEKIGRNDYLKEKIVSSDKYAFFNKTIEPKKNKKLYSDDEESDYDFKDLDELKKGENINKFENHNTINRETVVNNFSLHCPVSKINSEEYLHKARDEINKNERALNNILSNSYPLNTHFIHCRNCMLILAIKSKYYINK